MKELLVVTTEWLGAALEKNVSVLINTGIRILAATVEPLDLLVEI